MKDIMAKRRFEGLLSEEREAYLNTIEHMTFEERMKYDKSHPDLINEATTEIPHYDMTVEEICQKYGFVDMTDFFMSHGVKIDKEFELP